ncbi:hypothetical protein Tco_1184625, partial [Tanacetum coccineum]
LGLWYSRDSPFELVAYMDSNYAGATQDRKSTTGGCHFLGNRLISWQCKKQTVVATSTTKAEYVAAASCYRQVGDEAVHKELGDRMERVATTASSLEAEQDNGGVDAHTSFGATDKRQSLSMVIVSYKPFVDKKRRDHHGSSIRSDFTGRLLDGIDYVLDLEKVNDAQAKDIAGLKKRGRLDDAEMFDIDDLHDDEVIVDMGVSEKQEKSGKIDEKEVSTCVKDSVAPTIPVTTADEGVTAAKIDELTPTSAPTIVIDELTLAQTLIKIKAANPKAVTIVAITTTIRPKARGVIVQGRSEFRTTTSSPHASQPSKTKDKGKAIMIKPEVPLKRKDQVALDEEMARNLKAQLQAELIEEEKMARKKEEEANIALIESWENTQAMIEVDRLLAERLQIREQEELTDQEKAKLFMEFMERRRKYFAALREQEKRNRPPTKA